MSRRSKFMTPSMLIKNPQDETMRPTDSTFDKLTEVLEKKAQLRRRSQPHIENILDTSIPALKKMLLTCKTYLVECIASLTSHTVELYHFTKKTAFPHASNARETATHVIKGAIRSARPFFSQVLTMSKLYFGKVFVFMKPYASRIVCACEESIKSAGVNLSQTWIPALKKMLLTSITYLWECIASLTSHTVELYHFTMKTALPHAANAQETATHVIKGGIRSAQPLLNQVSTMSKLYSAKIFVFMKPYASRILCVCEEYIKSARAYLSQ